MKSLTVLLSLLVLGLYCEDSKTNGISENLPVQEGGDVVLHCDLGKLGQHWVRPGHGNNFCVQAPQQSAVSGGKIIGLSGCFLSNTNWLGTSAKEIAPSGKIQTSPGLMSLTGTCFRIKNAQRRNAGHYECFSAEEDDELPRKRRASQRSPFGRGIIIDVLCKYLGIFPYLGL